MPSPIKFDVIEGGKRKSVNGYCNFRKDSLAVYKDEAGTWHIVHKASGFDFASVLPHPPMKYTGLLNFIAEVKVIGAQHLEVLDRELTFGSQVRSPAAEEAANRLYYAAKQING